MSKHRLVNAVTEIFNILHGFRKKNGSIRAIAGSIELSSSRFSVLVPFGKMADKCAGNHRAASFIVLFYKCKSLSDCGLTKQTIEFAGGRKQFSNSLPIRPLSRILMDLYDISGLK
jgi:hypothetical protein